ncbi:unknown similar to AMEV137 [Adoxophyes honmai entomopoxvirus 'L']|uniref:Uncharacterized protein n=1 Tax=Adoxophyes honmai entomopoxvirus 'L' TaxID=1293540 RepID=A0A916KPN5_9POXV|nr:unknown similar to AMEV137 [Adoxophyes honmai entomopoxvirus 'L']CCU55510.1 unknown similar to AMEV137 [Adoxophyes honmai entomopoxvirus 'L']
MIFIYVLLFFLIIFIFIYIIIIIYLYNISYLPAFVPDEIIRQSEGSGDISNFIRIREEIIEYSNNIGILNNNISGIRQEIARLENTIEIQQLTIQTLRDELIKIENALYDQINLEVGSVNLRDNLQPLYILLESDYRIKKYIYSNVKDFIYKFIYLSQLYNKAKYSTYTKKLLANVFINLTYTQNINKYLYNKIKNDNSKLIYVNQLF